MQDITKRTLSIVAAACLSMPVIAGTGPSHWGYEGQAGPTHWEGLCQQGTHQSPIDIHDAVPTRLDPITFSYRAQAKEILNNGHTIQINMHEGSSIRVGSKTYQLLQFHFHSPSEHTINGKPADMVAHFVHQASDGQLGVIGVTMKQGKANPVLAELWQELPNKAGQKQAINKQLDVSKLMPADKAYYNYTGSLTTPPCSEGVNWMVLQRGIEVSRDQVAAFTELFPKSVRPVQPLNERIVKASR